MCFVKVFGATFLARPRSDEVKHAKEVSLSLRTGMAILALLTLVIGVSAGWISNILSGIVNSLNIFGGTSPVFYSNAMNFGLNNGFSAVSMPLILISLILMLGLTYFGVASITKQRKVKIGTTWDCGTNLGPRMEITSTGFARSIISIFQGILKPTKQVSIEYRDENMRYYQKSETIQLGVKDVYQSYFYNPARVVTSAVAEKVKKIQSGNVNMYILYILVILVALLITAAN